MNQSINKKLPAFTCILLFHFLLFNSGCSKYSKTPDPGKTNPGSSKIVYTDIKPDSAILKSSEDSFSLDLNNDGIADFEFNRSNIILCDDNLLGTWAFETKLAVKPSKGDNAIMSGGSNLPPALDSSTAIAPDSVWSAAPQVLLEGATSAAGHCITTLPVIQGYWLNVSDKYIGFKFTKANNTYYGWARMTSSYILGPTPYHHLIIAGQLLIKDYAFNSVPNQPILAGQTK